MRQDDVASAKSNQSACEANARRRGCPPAARGDHLGQSAARSDAGRDSHRRAAGSQPGSGARGPVGAWNATGCWCSTSVADAASARSPFATWRKSTTRGCCWSSESFRLAAIAAHRPAACRDASATSAACSEARSIVRVTLLDIEFHELIVEAARSYPAGPSVGHHEGADSDFHRFAAASAF